MMYLLQGQWATRDPLTIAFFIYLALSFRFSIFSPAIDYNVIIYRENGQKTFRKAPREIHA